MQVHVKVPRWLGDVIKYHMERLRLLNLDNSPPGVAMGEVTRIWAETIAATGFYEEALDAPRFHAAFMRLEATMDRWPAPKHLLNELPPRPELIKLPEPKISEEQREKVRARLAGLLDRLSMR